MAFAGHPTCWSIHPFFHLATIYLADAVPSMGKSAAYKTEKTPALGVDVPGGNLQGLGSSPHSPATHPCPVLRAPTRHALPPAVCLSSSSIFQQTVHPTIFLDTSHPLCNISPVDICSHQPVKCLESRNLVFCFFQNPPKQGIPWSTGS